MRKTALKYRAEISALEIVPDQVHLLGEVDPQFGTHRAGIQMHMVWANARQGRQVLPIVQVVLHLPCPERRTPVARPLAMSQLPDGPPAGRKRRRQSVCRGLENLSRGTLGDSLWRHGKT